VRANLPEPVVVFGGSGSVGHLLIERWNADTVPVVVVDRVATDDPLTSRVVIGDICAPSDDVSEALRNAAIVVLALPESVALGALPIVAGLLAPTALLVETLSVKSRFGQQFARVQPQPQCVGINPMFAPSLGMVGRPIAAVVHHSGQSVSEFLDTLTRWGSHVIQLGADAHDRRCAATQALTHATVLAFGLALSDLERDTQDRHIPNTALATPPHALILALLARIGGGTPAVYSDIQTANPYAAQARKAMATALTELSDVADRGSAQEFGELMSRALSPLGGNVDDYAAVCARLIEVLP